MNRRRRIFSKFVLLGAISALPVISYVLIVFISEFVTVYKFFNYAFDPRPGIFRIDGVSHSFGFAGFSINMEVNTDISSVLIEADRLEGYDQRRGEFRKKERLDYMTRNGELPQDFDYESAYFWYGHLPLGEWSNCGSRAPCSFELLLIENRGYLHIRSQ